MPEPMTEVLNLRCSKRQRAVIRQLAGLGEHEHDADLLRSLLAANAAANGIEWPADNAPKNGTERLTNARRGGKA